MSKDAIDEFQAFLDERLGRLEQAAAIAAAEIEMETSRSDLAGAIAARAERFSRMRAELDVDDAGGPSEGLELMIRQLAVAGAAPDEIERRLAHLGIEHSREAVGQIFRVGQH